ncbi:MAG: glycosyltransferase [Candidatus Sulfotelmatobacter sp.]
MRVLYVIPCRAEGNEFVFAKRQIACLEAAGITTRSFFVTSRTSISFLFRALYRLKDEIRRFHPDVVHAQFGTVNGILCVCAGASPLVVTFRGGDLNPTREVTRIRSLAGRLLSQLTALRAESTICVTERLRNRLWLRRDRSRVIPNGLDLSLFVPIPKLEARKAVGWQATERIVLVNAGRNEHVKRLDLALAAIQHAKRSVNDLRCEVLRGDTPAEKMPFYLNAADCLLVTSDWEGSPNIVKEALACNLPVVSVDVGDVPERLSEVIPSRIAERSPEALARCLTEVLQENRRSNGREKIVPLSDTAIADKILEVYRHVISESQGVGMPANQTVVSRPRQNH